ncbi:hypothetical protein FSB65_35805 [Paraburkholderia sp. JPY418]|nr:hypothetical protein [Paraburkholderia youngii]
MILSAEHGFIDSHLIIAPYERPMTRERSDAMLADLPRFNHAVWGLLAPDEILLAGGELYRRVMRAALAYEVSKGYVPATARVRETTGGIGYQRQQLGAWLREVTHPQE